MKTKYLIALDFLIILFTLFFILKEINYLMIIIALGYTSPIRIALMSIIGRNMYLSKENFATIGKILFILYILLSLLSLLIGVNIILGSFKVINII